MSKILRKLAAQIQVGSSYESDSMVSIPFTDGIINKSYNLLQDSNLVGTGQLDTSVQGDRYINGQYEFNLDTTSIVPILQATIGGSTFAAHSKKLSVYTLDSIQSLGYSNVYIKSLNISGSKGNIIKCSMDLLSTDDRSAVSEPTISNNDSIMWYKANDTPNDYVADLNATWNITPSYGDGKVDRCFEFDGNYPYAEYQHGVLTVDNNLLFNFLPSGAFSVQYWVKMDKDTLSQPGWIAKQVYYVGVDWAIGIGATALNVATVTLGVNYTLNSPVGGNYFDVFTFINDGEWHKILWTYSNGTHCFYLDSVYKATIYFLVGNRNYELELLTFNGAFHGSFDEIRFYDKVISVNNNDNEENIPINMQNLLFKIGDQVDALTNSDRLSVDSFDLKIISGFDEVIDTESHWVEWGAAIPRVRLFFRVPKYRSVQLQSWAENDTRLQVEMYFASGEKYFLLQLSNVKIKTSLSSGNVTSVNVDCFTGINNVNSNMDNSPLKYIIGTV
jgi:hypothetical protein